MVTVLGIFIIGFFMYAIYVGVLEVVFRVRWGDWSWREEND